MAELELICFGKLQMKWAGVALHLLPTDKNRALLSYLVLEAQIHQRAELAQLFWPGYSDESARNSLRQALYHLRQTLAQALPTSAPDLPWLLLTRQTVQLNPAAPLSVDVLTFRHLLATCERHTHSHLHTCAPCLDRLRQAVDLYCGDFLAGFTVTDSPPFEEWRLVTQERLQLQMLDALTHLATAAEAAGDDEQALHTARRLLTVQPWLEATQRQVMRLLARRGQHADALAQYEQCQQVLAKERRTTPAAETTALYAQIQAGSFPQVRGETKNAEQKTQNERAERATGNAAVPTDAPQQSGRPAANRAGPLPPTALSSLTPAPLHDWLEMPVVDLLAGRATELAQVIAWLTASPGATTPPVQVVALAGIGGIGKTTLAAATVKTVASHFPTIIWRSLLNAPPLGELLRQWLQLLSRQTLTVLPPSLDEQLRLLLTYLRQERCLLVLDNLESILAGNDTAGRAGAARAGYEGYEQLLQWLASSEHQSCLLLTSREQPYALAHLMRTHQDNRRVQMLSMRGLDQQAGAQLLQCNGLAASTTEAGQLVEEYSGNPLALQIVAATIVDFFAGDVAAFQQEASGLFDGIRLVLDQQFARLSALERELLFWLAIEREAVPLATLRSNLVQPASTGDVLAALQALQNRSLLEKRDQGLTLQNVIIEYCTERLVGQVGWELERELRITNYELGSHFSGQDAVMHNGQLATLFLNRFALLKAQAKTYVRESQARLLLQPLAERLVAKLGRAEVVARLPRCLDALRATSIRTGYAAGNLLNLLVQLGVDLSGYDFSALPVWQADLRGLLLAAPNFTNADLTNSAFTTDIQVAQVKFQPTGELMIVGVNNGSVCLWRTRDGQLKDAFQVESNSRNPLCFSPDGRYLAVAGVDYQIHIWSTADGAHIQTLSGHTSVIFTLAFSTDNRYLASGTAEANVVVWDVASGQPHYRLAGHEQSASALLFSPAGYRLATGSGAGLIQIWDLESSREQGQPFAILAGHTHPIGALAFSPDGRWLVSGSHDGEIRLWDLAHEGVFVQRFSGHRSIIRALLFQPAPAHSLAETPLAPTPYLFASASSDQTVRLWSLSGELRYTLLGHQHEVIGLTFSADGRQLVSAGAEQCIYWWDVQSGQAHNRLRAHCYGPNSVAFSPDHRLVASGSADYLVRLWPLNPNGTPTQAPRYHLLRGHTHFVRAVAFSPTGALIASGGHDHMVRIWDVQTRKERYTLSGHTRHVLALAFAPAVSTAALLASASADRMIYLWSIDETRSTEQPRQRALLGHEDEIMSLTFDPTGAILVSGSMDGSVRIWQVATGVTLHQLTGHTAPVTAVTISADGHTLATNSFDHTIRFWDLVTGACLQVERNNHIGAYAVKFGRLPGAPDELLAYSGNDYVIYLWRWRTAEPPVALRGHTAHVLALDFSRTAPLLISCSSDNTLRLWDLTTYQCVQILDDPGPYAGMQIAGVTGLSEAQKTTLKALGAVAA